MVRHEVSNHAVTRLAVHQMKWIRMRDGDSLVFEGCSVNEEVIATLRVLVEEAVDITLCAICLCSPGNELGYEPIEVLDYPCLIQKIGSSISLREKKYLAK
jgi:hypothetical protein